MSNKVVVILGPTSSGKTKWAVKLANQFNGEIVSADSRQVYKGMDVGTGKDLHEYKKVKYHLIDVVKPNQTFNLAKYQKLAFKAIDDVLKRRKVPIIAGGTGLYIQALVDNYQLPAGKPDLRLRARLQKRALPGLLNELKKKDLDSYKKVDKKNKRRVERALEYFLTTGNSFFKDQKKKQSSGLEFLQLGIKVDREVLKKRITKRLKDRLEREELVQEVKRLRKNGLSWKKLDSFGLEYRWVSKYVRGQIEYDEMLTMLDRAIKHFSKRQMTWFKRDQRIKWISDYTTATKAVTKFIKG